MPKWMKLLMLGPDTEGAGDGGGTDDGLEDEIEIQFTPDGNPPASPEDEKDEEDTPSAPSLEEQIAKQMASFQTQSSGGVTRDELAEMLKNLSSGKEEGNKTPQPDPNKSMQKFFDDNKDLSLRNPAEFVQKALDKFGKEQVAPALSYLRQENMQLRSKLDKQEVGQSDTNKMVMDDYGDEVEQKAQQLISQGVSNPYAAAVREVGWDHMAEIQQKQFKKMMEEQEQEKQKQTPPANANPNNTPVPRQRGKRVITLSEADKQKADTIGMNYKDYALSIGKK